MCRKEIVKSQKSYAEKQKSGRILYISDLHLFHGRMIELCGRPFADCEEMNRAIISNWIVKVRKEDTVYILGDVAMYHAEETADILKSLPGRKILITGNHDKHNLEKVDFRKAFSKIMLYAEIRDNGRKVVLFHYPIEEWDGYFRGFYHLYGQVHDKDADIKQHERKFNVSADVIGFEPKTLDELIELRHKTEGFDCG